MRPDFAFNATAEQALRFVYGAPGRGSVARRWSAACVFLPVLLLLAFPAGGHGMDLPADVLAFVHKRESCDHFRGEEAYDEDRQAFLNEMIAKECTGTYRDLAKLRAAYAENPEVLASLSQFETQIESSP